MSSIYFIANNSQLDISIFKRKWDDFCTGDILHFNRLFFFKHFELHPRNIIFHNVDMDTMSWYGIRYMHYYAKFNVKDRYLLHQYILHHACPAWEEEMERWKKEMNKWVAGGGKIMEWGNAPYIKYYPLVHAPSAGYGCYKYFRDTYDAIYLVGFTFDGSSFHSWKYEKDEMLNDPKVKVLE